MNDRQGLLRPSLDRQDPTDTALYSAQASFMTAFFGGPFAAVALSAVNSRRLSRLKRDIPVFAALVAAAIVAVWLLAQPDAQSAIVQMLGERGQQYAVRVLGLLTCGLTWLLHQRHYRAMRIGGVESPNGFVIGVICVVLGIAAWAGVWHLLAERAQT